MAPPVNSTTAPSFTSAYPTDSNDAASTTAQVGENNLAQIAERLGVDLDKLLAANPQIADLNKIQAGQDIHLPQSGDLDTSSDLPESSEHSSGLNLPRAPIGDPLAKTMLEDKLARDGGGRGAGSLPTQVSDRAAGFVYADANGGGSTASFKSKPPDRALRTPDAATVSQLDGRLKAAMKKAESGNEADRAEVDRVVRDIVKAYGIGQDGVSGLEYDPRSQDQGDTIGQDPKSFITVGKEGLTSPDVTASTVLHESNHVRRNKELADHGIKRDDLPQTAKDIYSDLTEMEGYQLEIKNAKKLGTSADYVKGAEHGNRQYLDQLQRDGAPQDVIDLAKAGRFDEAQQKFRQEVLKK